MPKVDTCSNAGGIRCRTEEINAEMQKRESTLHGKMKRLLALVMIMASVAGLSACGGSKDAQTDDAQGGAMMAMP
jgi:hypothetical protein